MESSLRPLPSYQTGLSPSLFSRFFPTSCNLQIRADLIVDMRHTVLLHNLQELDDNLGARADHDLALAGLLGVVDGVERIVEDGCLDHVGGIEDSRGASRLEVSVWLSCQPPGAG